MERKNVSPVVVRKVKNVLNIPHVVQHPPNVENLVKVKLGVKQNKK
jgi:hypothetical protein